MRREGRTPLRCRGPRCGLSQRRLTRELVSSDQMVKGRQLDAPPQRGIVQSSRQLEEVTVESALTAGDPHEPQVPASSVLHQP